MNEQSEEISLKELIIKLKEWFDYLSVENYFLVSLIGGLWDWVIL
jgi:hypothetical protein